MSTGLGITPLGGGVVGYGAPDLAPVQQKTILPSNGAQATSRQVSATTGQYVLNSFGQVAGMNGVQQLVLMRAKTVLNSSAMFGLGIAGPSGTYTADAKQRLQEQVRLAMKDIIDAGVIELLGVTIARMPSGLVTRHIEWRDLTATNSSTERTPF